MKKLILLLILFEGFLIHAQEVIIMDPSYTEISFEDTTEYKYVYISNDTVWYIAKPQKKELLSLPSSFDEYAIFTDTNQYYKSNYEAGKC